MTKRILCLIVVLVMAGCGWREFGEQYQVKQCVAEVFDALASSEPPSTEELVFVMAMCERAGAGK